jgi:CheY-like chemotaxis protein
MAVRECNAPQQPMDVLILDMLLPEQNGLEVIRHCGGVDQAVPIIAISGYGHTGPGDVLVTVTRQASGIYPQAGGTYMDDQMFPPCSMPSCSMTYSLSWRIWP